MANKYKIRGSNSLTTREIQMKTPMSTTVHATKKTKMNNKSQ